VTITVRLKPDTTVVFVGAVALLLAAACSNTRRAEPELIAPATIKDIMDSMVEPSADFIFDSVAEIADEHGISQKAPQTDEEWKEVRRRAVQLLEAPNLLTMPGRKVARPGERSENPEVELQPEQMQTLVDRDPALFRTRARALQDAAQAALRAIDAKNPKGLFDAATRLDKACESCHLQYWYPNDKRAQEAAKQNP
jgi:cytochrome c556